MVTKHNIIHLPIYRVGVGVSLTEIGVLWPVIEDHGKCGCGTVDLVSTVAYMDSRERAEQYVRLISKRTYLGKGGY